MTLGRRPRPGRRRRHTGDALTRPGAPAITYREFGRAVREIAGGLAALGAGHGDRVATLVGTRPEWTLVDFGALCAGAVVVPIYHTSSTEECAYVLAHSEARIVIVEDAAQAAKVEAIRDHCPALEHVIVMDGRADGAVTLRDVRARRAGAGGPVPAPHRGGRTGRCGHDRLHVGHDWADEGLRRHARQPALRRPHV